MVWRNYQIVIFLTNIATCFPITFKSQVLLQYAVCNRFKTQHYNMRLEAWLQDAAIARYQYKVSDSISLAQEQIGIKW